MITLDPKLKAALYYQACAADAHKLLAEELARWEWAKTHLTDAGLIDQFRESALQIQVYAAACSSIARALADVRDVSGFCPDCFCTLQNDYRCPECDGFTERF